MHTDCQGHAWFLAACPGGAADGRDARAESGFPRTPRVFSPSNGSKVRVTGRKVIGRYVRQLEHTGKPGGNLLRQASHSGLHGMIDR